MTELHCFSLNSIIHDKHDKLILERQLLENYSLNSWKLFDFVFSMM